MAGTLYLFSPRCQPYDVSPYRLCARLTDLIGSAEEEYRRTWPRRTDAEAGALIASLTDPLKWAVERWSDGGEEPSCVALAEKLVREIVAQQYVVFHHYETTRRDNNHWGI